MGPEIVNTSYAEGLHGALDNYFRAEHEFWASTGGHRNRILYNQDRARYIERVRLD